MWAWVALSGGISLLLGMIGGWIIHRERQAAEREQQIAVIADLQKENHALREALERSEKARMVAREGGGPERVLNDLGRLPKTDKD